MTGVENLKEESEGLHTTLAQQLSWFPPLCPPLHSVAYMPLGIGKQSITQLHTDVNMAVWGHKAGVLHKI